MAKSLTTFSITSPGYFGLNTQDSPIELDQKFALRATNMVIDRAGRLASRKGWTTTHTANADLGTADVECIGELVQNSGTTTILSAGNGYLFKSTGATLTKLTYGGGGVAPTITSSGWKFVSLNGVAMFFQSGHDPLIYDPAVSTTTFKRLSEKSGASGTIPQANEALVAYGRVWMADTAADKTTIVWSDLLTPHITTGGTAGSLQLAGVWPHGPDVIVALAAHNGNLVIFGKHQVLIYGSPEDPANLKLIDSVGDVGCIARDTVQTIENDLVFLSAVGVKSLQRTIQEKSAPIRSISKNIFDEIQSYIGEEADISKVKSGYSQTDAYYLLVFPESNTTMCFDMRAALQDGAYRVTYWNSLVPKALMYGQDREMYFGLAGNVARHATYRDNTSTYRIYYYGTWMDFGNPVQTSILKRVVLTVFAYPEQGIVCKYGFDYESGIRAEAAVIPGSLATLSEYNIAEYNIAEYNNGRLNFAIPFVPGGSGRVVQIGFESQIDGYPVALQRVDVLTKEGRV